MGSQRQIATQDPTMVVTEVGSGETNSWPGMTWCDLVGSERQLGGPMDRD
ncbi:hypothetical protein SCE1572_12690 [Sorangium cellulosum So0157-2]|uniref:Uncharacterized protein n=1 Tax=Sorangium cellulosum So0157-2 TaxID=1254432 RepID=S4XXF3_SORCE|nr:hypothetical protein SCE1572_12690 [Sorangium cellulosum So0157-2]